MDIWNDFASSPDFMGLMGFIGFILIIFIILLIFSFVLWIFQSIALYTLARNRGMSGAGLAWIPFIGHYRIGSVADNIYMAEGSKSFYGMVILLGTIATYALSFVPSTIMHSAMDSIMESSYNNFGFLAMGTALGAFAWIASLTLYVIQIISLYKIYKCYRPENTIAWTILSAIPFTSFLAPIFLFIIRNHHPRMQWMAPGGYPPNGYAQGGYPPPQGQYYPHQPYYPPPPQYQPPPPVYQPPGAPQPPEIPPPENNDDGSS